MGIEQPSAYYDKAYQTAPEYSKHWSQSRYLKLWEKMAEWLDKDKQVIDLGCGVGQLAEYLWNEKFKNYLGLDFSEKAIELANEKFNCNYDGYFTFQVRDINTFAKNVNIRFNPFTKEPEGFYQWPDISESPQFFISETLEHITKDTELLQLLCVKFKGSKISISVPSFNDPAHVRYFKSIQEAQDRYGKYIDGQAKQLGAWFYLNGYLI